MWPAISLHGERVARAPNEQPPASPTGLIDGWVLSALFNVALSPLAPLLERTGGPCERLRGLFFGPPLRAPTIADLAPMVSGRPCALRDPSGLDWRERMLRARVLLVLVSAPCMVGHLWWTANDTAVPSLRAAPTAGRRESRQRVTAGVANGVWLQGSLLLTCEVCAAGLFSGRVACTLIGTVLTRTPRWSLNFVSFELRVV